MTEPVERPEIPEPRYVPAEHVLTEMAEFGRRRLEAFDAPRVLLLAVMGGGFITMGALFSVLLGAGTEREGTLRLLEGLGFSGGFFFVVLSEAVLFTEANVVLPAALLRTGQARLRVARFWILALVGNFAGALLFGTLVAAAHNYSGDVTALLDHLVDAKMSFRADGGVGAWFRVLASGVLANWLVGMAAFFALMGRTLPGKYIPVFLAVTLFVSANFQHSPANMGYFSLSMGEGQGPGWWNAVVWNLLPAGIGNVLGGAFLVAVPFNYAFRRLPADGDDRDHGA